MSLVLAVPAVVHGGDAPDDPVSGPSVVTVRSLPTVVVEGARIQSPGLSPSGTNDYMITSQDISNLPGGENTVLTDVLSQLPGVGIDQNQQVHIRNTEGSGYQYQINGVLIPLDIITNPPFISMINPLFIKQLDLVDGILPSRYSYSTGGVVDIQSKDGCDAPGGSATLYGGQRATIQPSAQYSGCSGNFGYYGSALYSQNDEAFSSATPGPSAIHDRTHQGQTFNALSYSLDEHTRLNVILSAAASDNQLPNVPGLAPQYTLAGAAVIPSAQINSYLNFRDYLGLFSLRGSPVPELLYQVSYTAHSISQRYEPDDAGELLYQGVASRASHHDVDNALQGDLTFKTGGHALGAGFYLGIYDVTANSSSLVFPVDVTGTQTSSVPLSVVNDAHAANLLSGVYVNDLWQLDPAWRANIGLRRDGLTGFSPGNQVSPTFNLTYMPYAGTTIHGGVARYFQVPSFEGISPRAPGSFAGTTGAGPDGVTTPQYESDWEWDVGWVQTLAPGLTASVDNFYERTRHYLDAGQFGVIPIFAPFNYEHGYLWGSEWALDYRANTVNAYGNLTVGRNLEKGVSTGQFNFAEPGELAYINTHYIDLDHQPLVTLTTGATYQWNAYRFSMDAIFNTGLRSGFANLESLPDVFQVNVGLRHTFQIAGHPLTNQVTVLNIFDRTNLIRPSGGLGVFQSAYGPRLTFYDGLTLSF